MLAQTACAAMDQDTPATAQQVYRAYKGALEKGTNGYVMLFPEKDIVPPGILSIRDALKPFEDKLLVHDTIEWVRGYTTPHVTCSGLSVLEFLEPELGGKDAVKAALMNAIALDFFRYGWKR